MLTYMDLLSEFSGGCKNKNDGSVSSLKLGLVGCVDDGGDKEAHGLAGTSLGNGDQVISGHGNWPALKKNIINLSLSNMGV